MNRKDLIERGYFAKELPPCFTTKTFARELDSIISEVETKSNGELGKILSEIDKRTDLTQDDKAEKKVRIKTDFQRKLSYSSCAKYNIPKIGLSRKEIRITNPLQQARLVAVIEKHYKEIQKIYQTSNLSLTKPKIETDKDQGKRAITHATYSEFKEKCILTSYCKNIQLKVDISKFYHSIYTHIVPWATEGKQAYKKNRALNDKDPKKKKNVYGDEIDKCLMSCQAQQTKGIPIGPDTSLIVAEIIGCRIDNLFQNKLKKKRIDWVGFRYYDDYFLYFNSELEAEMAIDILEKTLTDFELELNQEKTELQKIPISFEQEWSLRLKSYYFRPLAEDQKEDIWNYFALAFKYAEDNPKDSVLKFALNKFYFVRIEQENWDFFEPLLLRVGLAEIATLQLIARILISYKSLVKKQRVKNFAYELIRRHYQKNYDYELTWALWLLKQFNISVRKDIFELIIKTDSVTALLICLDLLRKKKTKIDLAIVTEKILQENLVNKYWLLTYEIVLKGWLAGLSSKIVEDNFFFNILKNRAVTFYDENETLEPIKIQKSLLKNILKKVSQIEKSMREVKAKDKKISKEVKSIIKMFDFDEKMQKLNQREILKRLTNSEELISKIVSKLTDLREEQEEFQTKRVFFILEKRLGELQDLAKRELEIQSKKDRELLFDPDYT